MRMLAFAERNVKEIVRDPLSVIFGVGFPVLLLLLIHLLKSSLHQGSIYARWYITSQFT